MGTNDDEIPMFDDDATTGTTKRGVEKRSKAKAADSFVVFVRVRL